MFSEKYLLSPIYLFEVEILILNTTQCRVSQKKRPSKNLVFHILWICQKLSTNAIGDFGTSGAWISSTTDHGKDEVDGVGGKMKTLQ